MPRKTFQLISAAFFLFLPPLAHACAVCFGMDPGGGMKKGFFWGVVLLLALPFSLLGGLVLLIVHHSRKNRKGHGNARLS